MKKNNGGPAFPVFLKENEEWVGIGTGNGMSLRDYFAAKAIQGMSNSLLPHNDPCESINLKTYQYLAEKAYCLADAMIAEREK